MTIPYIDPRVHGVGTSRLREMNASELRALKDELYLIYDGADPVAVLASYETWTRLQVAQHGDTK